MEQTSYMPLNGIDARYKLNGADRYEHILNTLNSLLGTSVSMKQARAFVNMDDVNRYERFVVNKAQLAIEQNELDGADRDALNLFVDNAFTDIIVEAYKDDFLKIQTNNNNSKQQNLMANNLSIVGGTAAPTPETQNVAQPQVTNDIEKEWGKFFAAALDIPQVKGQKLEWTMEGKKVVLYVPGIQTTFVYDTESRHRDQWTMDDGVKFVWKNPGAVGKAFAAMATNDSAEILAQLTPACYNRIMGGIDKAVQEVAPEKVKKSEPKVEEKTAQPAVPRKFSGETYMGSNGAFYHFSKLADGQTEVLAWRNPSDEVHTRIMAEDQIQRMKEKNGLKECEVPTEYYDVLAKLGFDIEDEVAETPTEETPAEEVQAEEVESEKMEETEPVATPVETVETETPAKEEAETAPAKAEETHAAKTAEAASAPIIESNDTDLMLTMLEVLEAQSRATINAIKDIRGMLEARMKKAV